LINQNLDNNLENVPLQDIDYGVSQKHYFEEVVVKLCEIVISVLKKEFVEFLFLRKYVFFHISKLTVDV